MYPRPLRLPVHPRVCGEQEKSFTTVSIVSGSSRVCGEQPSVLNRSVITGGSSPRVRGTVIFSLKNTLPRRFIPACAGNRGPRQSGKTTLAVHPRVCGEQICVTSDVSADSGSSPRVRGTVIIVELESTLDRFIPACAGNSTIQGCCLFSTSVHPRVCGEQVQNEILAATHNGSSPRVRGTASHRHFPPRSQRFIPACAGNRSLRDDRRTASPVHPRVCGEQPGMRHIDSWKSGSSPRVRGTVRGFRFVGVK